MVYTENEIYLSLLNAEKKLKKKKPPSKNTGKKCLSCKNYIPSIGKDRKNGKEEYKDWNRKFCKKCWKEQQKTKEFLEFFN
tara:strand:- start:241 stop:483 length:243 start_codon:yes stop_codon:yes gene_type:complete